MQILNVQDGFVKSPLVQLTAERAAELAKVQDAAQVMVREEEARKADEVVIELHEAENETIRNQEENKHSRQRRRKERLPEDDERETANRDTPTAPGGYPHLLDVTA